MSISHQLKSFCCAFLLLISLLISTAFAVEIKGKVIEIDGSRAKIAYDSDFAPREGDKVKVGSEIPDIGFVPVKGMWKVTDVTEDFVWAEPEDSDVGAPGFGYIAIIFSENPRARSQFEIENRLLKASKEGDLEQVRMAIQAGANVNVKGKDGSTPLGLAAGQGCVEIVRALIKAGANIDWEAPRGQTALNVAAFQGHTEIVRTLIEAGADVNARIESKKGPEGFRGATPLLMASRTGQTETVRILLQSGAKVDARNTSGDTPLFLAALSGYSETVRTLIQAGADVEARNNQGATPLMCAAESGQLEVLWLLVDAGADVNAKITGDVPSPYAGATALMIAAHQGHPTIVAALVTSRANVRATNSEGQTALMLASQEDHPQIAEILREPVRSPQAARRILSQDLVKAVDKGALQTAKILIWFGADVNTRDEEGSPVLMRAVQAGFIDIVRSLLDHGADVNGQGEYGETPLMVAAVEGQTDIVQILIQSGADVNRKAIGDEKGEGAGWTALMGAAMEDHEKVVRQLLAAGADLEATNDAGETALDIAESSGSMKALRLLEAAKRGERPEGFIDEHEGQLLFSDAFNREELGQNWRVESGNWVIDDGKLRSIGRNGLVWLMVEMPDNIRVEIEVEGAADLNLSIAGNGIDPSGYLLSFGGWWNTKTALVVEGHIALENTDLRITDPNETYLLRIERKDNILTCFVNGDLVSTYDQATLRASGGHNKISLRNWGRPITFDNLKITSLE